MRKFDLYSNGKRIADTEAKDVQAARKNFETIIWAHDLPNTEVKARPTSAELKKLQKELNEVLGWQASGKAAPQGAANPTPQILHYYMRKSTPKIKKI